MLTPLKEAAYFARRHAQPLLTIAIVLAIPSWIIHYASPAPSTESGPDINSLLTGLLIFVVGVIQFAAAMFYIHHQVQAQPISSTQAIGMAARRTGALLLINLLMGLAVAAGLLLLVLPGLYIAYKLIFSEFYLLFHRQGVVQSLRSSYKDNVALTDKLLPPLLAWIGIIICSSILHQHLLEPDGNNLIIHILFETLSVVFTLWGWALIYRLYQCHIAPDIPAIAEPSEPPEKLSDKE